MASFKADKLLVIPDDQVTELIKPVLDHLGAVICRTDEELQYLLAWLAQHVQHPAHKTGVALVLTGDQGVGKNIIFDWYIQYLLGTDVGMQTANVSHILGGRHSTVLQNKVLCVVDGDDPVPLGCHVCELKDLVTSPTIHVQPMCKSPYTVPNTSNFMITTNEKNPFPLVPSDPRFVVFECNDSKKGDFAYFENLAKNLNDASARAFYQYLLGVDLSDYGCFKAKRPDTQMYRRQLKETHFSAFHSFLAYQCGKQAESPWHTRTLAQIFQMFKQWAIGWAGEWTGDAHFDVRRYTAGNLHLAFGNLISTCADCGVVKKRTAEGWVYSIQWAELAACLERGWLFNLEEEETHQDKCAA